MVAPRGQAPENGPADLADALGPHLDAAYCCARLLGCSELEAAVAVDEAALDLVEDLRTATTRAADPVAGLLRRTWLLARRVRTQQRPPGALAQLTDRQVLLVVLADHFQLPEVTVAAAAGLVGLIADVELRQARRALLGLPEEAPVAEPYLTRVLPARSPTARDPTAGEPSTREPAPRKPAPREPVELAAAAAAALATAPALSGAGHRLPDSDRAQVLGHLAGQPLTPGPVRSAACAGPGDVAAPATSVLGPATSVLGRAPAPPAGLRAREVTARGVDPTPGEPARHGAGSTRGPRTWVVVAALALAALLGAGAGALFHRPSAARVHTADRAPVGSVAGRGHVAGHRAPRVAHPKTTPPAVAPPADSAVVPNTTPTNAPPSTRPAAAQQQVPTAQPRISLAPASGPDGTLITVTGTGWAPGSTVQLSYETLLGVTGASAQATVGADGSFRAQLRASDPTHLAGRHTVRAVDGAASASATFVATT